MEIVAIIFGLIVTLGAIYFIWHSIMQSILFKQGHNPYCRICRRCGAHQVQYGSNIIGNEHITWWQEVYPIGNNPKCKCHNYSEYHS